MTGSQGKRWVAQGTWRQEGRTANQWSPAREDLASKNSSMMSVPEQRLLWLQEQKFLIWNSIGGFVTNTSHDRTYYFLHLIAPSFLISVTKSPARSIKGSGFVLSGGLPSSFPVNQLTLGISPSPEACCDLV